MGWRYVQMNIFIEKLHVADEENLFNFEVENRTFFEEMVPTRGDEYYNFEAFKKDMKLYLKNKLLEVHIFI